MKKQEFIVYLRALAAITVLLSHLLCMFWNGGVGSIWPFLQTDPAPVGLRAINPANYLAGMHLNAGAIGVAVFFLITGYLAAWSIDKYTKADRFFAVKALRIYPVYIVEFSVTFLLIYLYTCRNGIAFPYSFKDWLTQVSLLRAFFWLPSIDAISWTLVADIQFYLLIAVLIALKRTSARDFTAVGVMLSLAAAVCSFNMPNLLAAGQVAAYRTCSHVTQAAFCLSFMLLGTVIGEFERRNIDRSRFFGSAVVLYLSFLFCCVSYAPGSALGYIFSYTLSLLVFAVCLVLEKGGHGRKLFENRCLGWVSRISYSLFILHGLNGYMLETALYRRGVNNYVNFIVTVAAVTVLSALMYYCCERPFAIWHRKLSQRLAG